MTDYATEKCVAIGKIVCAKAKCDFAKKIKCLHAAK